MLVCTSPQRRDFDLRLPPDDYINLNDDDNDDLTWTVIGIIERSRATLCRAPKLLLQPDLKPNLMIIIIILIMIMMRTSSLAGKPGRHMVKPSQRSSGCSRSKSRSRYKSRIICGSPRPPVSSFYSVTRYTAEI